ncbi:response regulator transcription factor [Pendulispora brunnea]|uniref:Response regulator transcription factor n=1 Tax=Pendulispora brunnea TaxID=2905690 RepID=A0ABZ2KIN6_9BACT
MTHQEPSPDTGERILLVDDEVDLQKLFLFNFREAGFAPEAVGTAREAFEAAARQRPVVVVLDLMLPDISGTEVCRRMRADPALSDVGILMLTARGDEYDRILGFEVGADDYVVKPFSVRELVLRVRALVRRVSERTMARRAPDTGVRLRWRGLEVDTVRQRVYIDGAELSLRPLEYKLIAIFLENAQRTFTRRDLLEEVWGMSGSTPSRTVDTHVRRLRERLGAYGDAVETVHSVGYRLRTP